MDELFQQFLTFVKQNNLIQKNNHVLVAVSGGVDSVVLLDLLAKLMPRLGLMLEIVHLNHGIRGYEAKDDQRFVEGLAKSYNLPIISEEVNTLEFITDKSLSLEEGARILRYQFFEKVLQKQGADSLALGHHADDQVETVIQHFIRGSGIKGLAGIQPRRGRYIRPLLFSTRSKIETYALTHSLDYRVDLTNINVQYRRNKIRHQLIPFLKEHFSAGISKAILRTSKIMFEAEEYLIFQAKQAFEQSLVSRKKDKIILEIESFLDYFIIIQKYVVFYTLEQLGYYPRHLTSRKIERIISLIKTGVTGKKEVVDSQIQILIDNGQVVFYRQSFQNLDVRIELERDYLLKGGEIVFRAERITREELPEKLGQSPHQEYVDYEKVKGTLRIRTFRKGDRFQPINFKGHKKVSDFFTDLKIPRHERPEIPILECDVGIIWVVGYKIDDRFKITKQTKQVLRLEIREGMSL